MMERRPNNSDALNSLQRHGTARNQKMEQRQRQNPRTARGRLRKLRHYRRLISLQKYSGGQRAGYLGSDSPQRKVYSTGSQLRGGVESESDRDGVGIQPNHDKDQKLQAKIRKREIPEHVKDRDLATQKRAWHR